MGMEKPISFEDIFQGFLNFGTPKQDEFANPYKRVAARCPSCGMTYDELRRTGKFGCSSCYDAFEPYITGSLKSIHGDNVHKGKVPKRNGGPFSKSMSLRI